MKGILVGLGSRGRSWLKVCRDHAEIELTAFVETAPKNRMRAVEELGLPEDRICESLGEAIGLGGTDFVLDVTPPSIHEEIALIAFDAGLHVLGEKPMSNDYAAAERMVEAGTRAGLRHMLTQNYRFGRVPRTTRRLVAEGVVGKRRETLGAQFKLAVNDRRWVEAARVGETIIAEFPNAKMAEEVRSMIDILRSRAGQAAVAAEEAG